MTDEAGRAERALTAKQRDLHQVESALSLTKQQQAKAQKEVKGTLVHSGYSECCSRLVADITAKIEEETEGQDLATAISEAELEIKTRHT